VNSCVLRLLVLDGPYFNRIQDNSLRIVVFYDNECLGKGPRRHNSRARLSLVCVK
jgi:hypothetical protein